VIDEESGHTDESGGPCMDHAPVRPDVMLRLALVGSRATGFNHDLASKLQALLMTLEDLAERLGERGEPELHRAASDGFAMATEIAGLITESRALTRPPTPARRSLRELIAASCKRAGVGLTAEIVDAEVELAAPHVVHAISLAIEVAAGPGRGRALESTCRVVDGRIELVLAAARKTTSYASEYLALAAASLRPHGGDVGCGAERIVILLRPVLGTI
jgi:hypothetical protein